MEEAAAPRYDRRPMIVGGLAVLAILALGAIDVTVTASRVPEVPAACDSLASACQDERNLAFQERLERALELTDDLDARAWLYAATAFIAGLVATLVGLRRNPPARRREVFTDLGVGAVIWLLAGLALSIFDPDDLIDVPSEQLFYPPIGLAAFAAIGTLVTRRPPAQDAADADPTAGPAVRWIGYSATVVGVAFAWIGASERPDPCSVSAPEEHVLVGWSLLAAAVAIACGIASLFQRRWIGALIMFGAAPFASLLALFTGACWN